MLKVCRICQELKPITDFYAMAGMKDGHRNECKRCNLEQKAARYRANPEPEKARATAWRRNNPEREKATKTKYRQDGRKTIVDRKSYLKRKYGMTVEEYDDMLAAQGGVCAICGRPPHERISLHVDHDHETGRLRKLLCFPCNNLLGDANDEPAILRGAADYLDACDPDVEALTAVVRARVLALKTV